MGNPKVKFELYPEICCDYCNDVIHNHMDCPVCNEDWAETDMFHDIQLDWNYGKPEEDVIIQCECGAEFKVFDILDCNEIHAEVIKGCD